MEIAFVLLLFILLLFTPRVWQRVLGVWKKILRHGTGEYLWSLRDCRCKLVPVDASRPEQCYRGFIVISLCLEIHPFALVHLALECHEASQTCLPLFVMWQCSPNAKLSSILPVIPIFLSIVGTLPYHLIKNSFLLPYLAEPAE